MYLESQFIFSLHFFSTSLSVTKEHVSGSAAWKLKAFPVLKPNAGRRCQHGAEIMRCSLMRFHWNEPLIAPTASRLFSLAENKIVPFPWTGCLRPDVTSRANFTDLKHVGPSDGFDSLLLMNHQVWAQTDHRCIHYERAVVLKCDCNMKDLADKNVCVCECAQL